MSNAFEHLEPTTEDADHLSHLIGGVALPKTVKPDQIPRGLSLVKEELPVSETLEDIWGKHLKASTTNRPEEDQTVGR